MLGIRLRRLLPVALLVVLVACVYAPLFAGQVLFQRDIGRQIFPERAFLAQAWAAGDSSLWNPLVGLGLGTLDNPLNQLIYPPSLVLLWFPSARAISWWLFLHMLAGGVGMIALARALGVRSRAAAAVAGLAWCLSGYCTSEFTAGLRLVAAAYVPWCGLAFLQLARQVRVASPRACLRAIAVASLPTALLILTGEVFVAVMAVVFGLALWLVDGAPRAMRRPGLRFLVSAGSVGALAVGMAAVSLIPVLRGVAGNQRGQALSRATAEVGSFHPLRVLELTAPGALGDPYGAYPAGRWIGEPGMDQRPLIYGAYVGASVLALALMAFERRRRAPVILGALAVLSLLAAMGRHTPVHAGLRWVLLPLAFMRGPEKYLLLFQTAVALLAALGVERLQSNPPRLWLRSVGVAGPLAALVLVAPLLPPELATVREACLYGLGAALAIGALAWLAARRPTGATALVLAVVTLDLAAAVWGLQSFGPARLLDGEPQAARAIRDDAHARGLVAPPRVHRLAQVDAAIERQRPPRTVAEVQANLVHTLIDNHVTSFHVGSVPGYDAATPNSLRSLWSAGPPLDILRLTGVDYVVAGVDPVSPDPPGLSRIIDPAPGTRVFRLNHTLPRVYVVGQATPLPEAPARQAVFAPDVLAGRRIVVDPEQPGLARDVRGTCRITRFQNTRVEAACESDGPALAVFVEQFAPGWTAQVDGARAPCVRANLALRAVPIPAGRHTVVLSYSPPGLSLGMGISILALAIVAAALVVGRTAISASRADVLAPPAAQGT